MTSEAKPAEARTPPKRRQLSERAAIRRAERQQSTRRKLLEAAARIIGQHGYAGCSVARITRKARIAHGTFYLYFKSQQELFDTILPTVGLEMLDDIAEAVGDERDPMEIERLGFTANVKYTAEHLFMNRVLYEAQLFSPSGYATYFSEINRRYVRSLRRSVQHGHFADATESELETVAAMVVGARTALLFKINKETVGIPGFQAELIDSYLKFVRKGLDI